MNAGLCSVSQADTLHNGALEGEEARALPSSWPEQGRVSFVDVRLRYHADAPLALAGLSLDIRPGQKLGICGRTGNCQPDLISCI